MVFALAASVPVGEYINAWKVLPLLLMVLLWARLITWIDKDAPRVLLPRVPINLGNIVGGIAAIFLFLVLPGFWLAFAVLFVLIAAEIGVYLILRNQKVGLSDLGDQFRDWLASFTGEKRVKVIEGEVQLIGKNGNLLPAPETEAPERPAYDAIQSLLTDPLRRNAEQIDLVPADGTASVRYIVDGVSYAGLSLEKARAAHAVQYLKELADLDLAEKRKPQSGTMKVSIDGLRRELQVITAGSTAGEQLRALVDPKKRHDFRLEQLGMSEDQVEIIRETIRDNTGLVILSAPKGHGLTTLQYAIIRAHDAFLTHIQTLEAQPDLDLEGVTQNRISFNAPGEPLKTVNWTIDQEPDVILMSRMEDSKSGAALAKYAGAGKRVYLGLRAGNTFDALAAWRQLVADDNVALKNLRMIVCARVLRKLCPACKAGYAPDPATLRKLNLDPDKVGRLYQARTQPLRDPKGNPITCEFCKELYFKGRIGVYEIFLIGDEVRDLVTSGGSINQLKALFRKQQGRFLQEMALEHVADGETSIQEVVRVMKADQRPPSSGARPTQAPAKPIA